MGRLVTRLALAMMAVAVVALLAITISQAFILTREVQRLSPELRSRILHRRPPPRTLENQEILRGFTRFRDAQARSTVIGLSTAGLLAVVLAVLLARTIAKPVERMSHAATRLAGGDLGARVELSNNQLASRDQISELARNFNSMARSLENYERERQAMIADISYELRTPLAAMQLRLEAILDGLVPCEKNEAERLLRQTGLLTRLVEDLRTLSLADASRLTLQRRDVDLAELASEVLAGHQEQAARGGVTLELLAGGPIIAKADPDRLTQVLGNLVDNALRVTPVSGTITVRIEERPQHQQVVIAVEDSGPGIPETELPGIFKRFMQGKDTRGKSGLGLAIVKTLVELHGGRIGVANRQQGGAIFTITLPKGSAAG